MTRISRSLIAATFGAALVAGAWPADAQQRGGPPSRPDPFMQTDPGERDWFTGPMQDFYEGRRGRSWKIDPAFRDEHERGYRTGRAEERLMRDPAFRERVARDRMEGRATYGQARDLLDMAQREIDRGNLRDAWVALGRAETRLITRAGRGTRDEQAATGGAVGAIRDAREALMDGNRGRAMDLTDRAQALVQRGNIIGEAVSGRLLSGAGIPGPEQPFTGGSDGGMGGRMGGGR